MDKFDDYTYLNRWGLSFLGIWRDGKGGERRVSRSIHITILFVLMMLLLIPQWLDLYVLWGNIDAFAETFVLNVFTITAMLKLLNFVMVADVFEDVLVAMEKDWNQTMTGSGSDRETNRRILVDMAGNAYSYTKRYGLLMYSTATMYFVSPFVGMQNDELRIRKYPFFGWYYFDRFSDLYYGLCYLSQVIIGIVVGTSNYSMDSIFLVAIYHTCAQIKIIQHGLENIGDKAPNQIVHLVHKHQKVIRTCRKLEAIFNGSSEQQLIVSCIIICIIGFKLIIALNKGGFEFLIYIAFMFVAILQIFLYCRPGDELISQSTAIGYAAYLSSWDSLDPKSIRNVSMIILRSQRALNITAGKIFVLSLPNFTKILKTSMSFLSILRAMY